MNRRIMDNREIEKLKQSNARIIEIVLAKIACECLGSVDLFGVNVNHFEDLDEFERSYLAK